MSFQQKKEFLKSHQNCPSYSREWGLIPGPLDNQHDALNHSATVTHTSLYVKSKLFYIMQPLDYTEFYLTGLKSF